MPHRIIERGAEITEGLKRGYVRRGPCFLTLVSLFQFLRYLFQFLSGSPDDFFGLGGNLFRIPYT